MTLSMRHLLGIVDLLWTTENEKGTRAPIPKLNDEEAV